MPEAIEQLLGGPPVDLALLGGGRNSRVFRVTTREGQPVVLKEYFRDTRDRLGTELGALRFLWDHGVRCIPEPLAMDRTSHRALYEFIEGDPVVVPTLAQVDEACDFLARLHGLSHLLEAQSLPHAAEARFSLKEIAHILHHRMDRLQALHGFPELSSFLQSELHPAMEMLLAQVHKRCAALNIPFETEIPVSSRTLSPSDFGFHNALLRKGKLCFLDFEYFGWDDPAKLISDFLLHPGMDLSLDLRRRYAQGVLARLPIPGLARRTRLAFPLFGLKWCLILLNEFLEEDLERRAFADGETISAPERQGRQLAKARRKLEQTLDEHGHFPTFDDAF